jgi:hypothetical protein
VIVIGGGDTGTDCVGTSMRHGCKTVTQIEILPKPPMERAADNPWPEWPKVYKMDYGQEEAAAKFGADPRVYLTTVKKFIGDAAGNVQSLVTVEIKWERNDKGQFIPKEQPGTEKTISGAARAARNGLSRAGADDPAGFEARDRPAVEHQGRAREVPHQRAEHLRRRRLPPWPESRGVGDQRGPRRRARVRPLPDGRNGPPVAWAHARKKARRPIDAPFSFFGAPA